MKMKVNGDAMPPSLVCTCCHIVRHARWVGACRRKVFETQGKSGVLSLFERLTTPRICEILSMLGDGMKCTGTNSLQSFDFWLSHGGDHNTFVRNLQFWLAGRFSPQRNGGFDCWM